MCKSASEGGQRCATHTRAAFQRTLATANDPGHETAFDNAAIEHATTKQGRLEVEALLTFATSDRTRLRIENLLMQADQRRTRRDAVDGEVTRQLQLHRGGGQQGNRGQGNRGQGNRQQASTDTRPSLRLVHSTPPPSGPCDTCSGTGEDYDGYWGCDACGGTGVEPARPAHATPRL